MAISCTDSCSTVCQAAWVGHCAGSVTPVWMDGWPPCGGREELAARWSPWRTRMREGTRASNKWRATQQTTLTQSALLLQLTHYSPASPLSPCRVFYIIVSAVQRQWQLILRQSNAAVQTDVNSSLALDRMWSHSTVNDLIAIRSWWRQALVNCVVRH